MLASLELLMLTALVLICSLTTTPNIRDCNRNNAIDVMWVPETFGNPITCYMHGQAYVAGTSLGRSLTANEHIKVMCLRRKRAALPADATIAERAATTAQ